MINETNLGKARSAHFFASFSILVLLIFAGCDAEEEATTGQPMQDEEPVGEVDEADREAENNDDESETDEPSVESDPDQETDFLDFRWGMTKDEVVAQLDTTDYRESQVEITIDGIEWLGFDTTRDFIFDPDTGELKQIAHRLDTTEMENEPGYSMAEGTVAYEYFTKVQRELESEFSSFEEDHVGFGSLYGDRDFDDMGEDQLGVAVGTGAVVSQAVAEPEDEVVIRHWIQFTNDDPSHNIVAFDPEHEAENYADLKDIWEFAAER